MESKYYTPDISEFHVGFKYEYKNSTNNIWYPQIFNRGIGFQEYPNLEDCRVKYLDQEDIKSFGFGISMGCNEYEQYSNKDSNVFLHIQHSNKKCTIFKSTKRDKDLNMPIIKGSDIVFEGIIKNKSEFRVLLKQLRIDD